MENNVNELFWNADIGEIKVGYIEREEDYVCVVCGESFEKGRIFEVDGALYEAKRAVVLHVGEAHDSMLSYMVGMNNSFLGVTEVQKHLVQLLAKGCSDKEVAEQMGINASTVRNHRYRLREKEKQAKLFLALMQLLQEEQSKPITVMDDEAKICDAPKTATMVDDRYNTTEEEKEKIIKTYFEENGHLKQYPSKEKRKLVVLEHISQNFKKGKFYKELEINRVLKRIYEDHVTLRRAMIEYGFMERAKDGDSYWIKE